MSHFFANIISFNINLTNNKITLNILKLITFKIFIDLEKLAKKIFILFFC